MAELRGYIIAQKEWNDETALAMSHGTFSTTTVQAWMRHTGYTGRFNGECSAKVQLWSNRGYSPRCVTLKIEEAKADD